MSEKHPALHVEARFGEGFDGFAFSMGTSNGPTAAVLAITYRHDVHTTYPITNAIHNAQAAILGGTDIIDSTMRAYEVLKTKKVTLVRYGVTGVGLIAVRNADTLTVACGDLRASVSYTEGDGLTDIVPLENPNGAIGETIMYTGYVASGQHHRISLLPNIAFNPEYAPCPGLGVIATLALPRPDNQHIQ